ncbi:SDR family oxidoreductase [Blattabacterium cuenoti]|uniref:SDR family oxidoreductase n=1 Tax=Blattabacterium cuenoti TaxID=1653831 RepID=UPI00163D004B|nr:SDR family oxidoreductase [Blattabacterium cuenoti]
MKKKVIITGSGNGIGYEIAKEFLNMGHHVLAISRDVSKLLKLKNRPFGICIPLEMDLTQKSSYKKIEKILLEWMFVDILINNAGLLVKKNFDKLKDQDIYYSYEVNIFVPIKMIQLVKPYMGKKSHIVNIGSMGGIPNTKKFPGLSIYSSSKAALSNLTEVIAEEFKEEKNGPSVNCLALGAVQSKMLKDAFPCLYDSSISSKKMAQYIYSFSIEGNTFFNGKTIPISSKN